MLDIKYIRKNKEEVIRRLLIRGVDYTNEINYVIDLDDKRKKAKKELDDVRHQKKLLSNFK